VNRHINSLVHSSRKARFAAFLVLDVGLILLGLWAAYFLRMDTFIITDFRFVLLGLAAPVIAIPVFIHNGVYRAIIRYLTADVIWTILRAVTIYCVLWALVALFSGILEKPRSIILINWGVSLILIGGARFLAWYLTNLYFIAAHKSKGDTHVKKVLIYGAGEAGIQICAGLSSYHGTEVVGFIDDSSLLQNQSIQGKRVYPSGDLSRLAVTLGVSEILLAMPSVSRSRRVEILSALESLPIPVRTLPDIALIASGKVNVQDIREISIDDLLGRESVSPDETLMRRHIDNCVVMVTGAGGSIGAELCRQISRLNPRKIILFEQSEFNLYKIDRELRSRGVEFVPVLGSVSDMDHVAERCETLEVDTIFHAAAYKHVPLVEMNPAIGVKNNVLGTYATAMAAIRANVKSFVLISTDKAVRPANVMGATKRFSELILQSINARGHAGQTRFIIVRFGNVIDSSGSVIPLFRDQINMGGPVTVTHEEVTRYFMTIPEAAQLVIQAGAMGNGGEVFVLDMGESVRIHDLAVKMIKLSGLVLRDAAHPDGDIEIEFSGLRPGEKLHEELLIGDNVVSTQHDRIMSANEKFLPWQEIQERLDQLEIQVRSGNTEQIKQTLAGVVEGYSACS